MQIGLRRRLFCEIGKTQNNLLRRRLWQEQRDDAYGEGIADEPADLLCAERGLEHAEAKLREDGDEVLHTL